MAIRVETAAFNDIRFVLLGKRLGTSKFDALARVQVLWEYCTQRETYFISSKEIINALCECEGISELLLDPEIDLAEEKDHGIYIRGVKGRVEWLANKRKNGKKGGRPKKPKVKISETETKPNDNLRFQNQKADDNPTTTVTATVTATTTVKRKYSPEFERFWEKYPRKIEKEKAFETFLKVVKDSDPNLVVQASGHYAAYVAREGTERKYIKHATTFLNKNTWRGYIEAVVEAEPSERDPFSMLPNAEVSA